MHTRRIAVIGFALTLSLLGACAGDDGKSDAGKDSDTTTAPAGGEATTEVAVKDFVFSPEAIKVKVGDTVTWTNEDEFDHSVDIASLDLEGANFGPQTMPLSFSHQFTKAGTFEYLCGVHNSMTGSVVVTS